MQAPTICAADLDRGTNTGRIYHLHRAWPCEFESCTGRCTDKRRECLQPAEACSEIGADPVAFGRSMRRHYATAAAVQALWLGAILAGVVYGLLHYLPALLAH